MSYQVLARKWRPRTFQAMVGQEHVLRMLTNALNQNRLHHAYLFTGTRGVGKTTLGRILAKCLNCETGITSTPCNTCQSCAAIDVGRFLDLIEVDAASRTKVEDTRELLENVQYQPAQGRFKVYLIDEVHMLSGHSFNALLKTLEEPPPYVKFLLATTDPKRLPITILSRCLQFNLKRVPPQQIRLHLEHICNTENIAFEASALPLLADAADGSLRDALSLLDQAIAFCGEKITLRETQQMLGSVEQDALFRLLHALANRNGQQLLTEIAQLAEHAVDFNQALDNLLSILHEISLIQVIGNQEQHEQKKQLATLFSAEDIQLYYQIALIGRRDLSLASTMQQGFEMTLLRMLAFTPVTTETTTPTAETYKQNLIPTQVSMQNKTHANLQNIHKPPTQSLQPAQKPIRASNLETTNAAKSPAISPPKPQNIESSLESSSKTTHHWTDILKKLNLSGMSLALASNCTMLNITDTHITLALSTQHQAMCNKKLIDRIEQALQHYFNQSLVLDIKITTDDVSTPAKQREAQRVLQQKAAMDAIKNDNHVKRIMDVFNATLDENSIKAI
jgi:DNA polymerase-3 subunit gamma/tau